MTRVLIVDDHPLFRDGLAGLLATLPEVEVAGTAGTAEQALAAITETAPADGSPGGGQKAVALPQQPTAVADAGRIRDQGAPNRAICVPVHRRTLYACLGKYSALGVT